MKELIAPHIYTLNGFVKENIFSDKRVLDVGCGGRKLPGSIGMDRVKELNPDFLHDMEDMPWPFKNNEFDLVFLNHALEHVSDILETLKEIHRITKKGGHVVIQVPYFRATDAYADPTHKHFFTSRTLDYVIERSKLSEYQYMLFKFKKAGFWYGWPHHSKNPLKQFIKNIMHRYPDFYDQYLSLLLPTDCVTWELEVMK